MKVSDEKLKSASKFFNDSLDFQNVLGDRNLLNDAQQTSTGFLMKCPFHDDSSPSMRVDVNRNVYKCFAGSCGCQGNIITFITDYEKVVMGVSRNYFQTIELLLKGDPNARRVLGFNSIYEEGIDLKTFKADGLRKFKIEEKVPKTFLQLSNYIKAHGSVQDRIDAIKLMQEGFDADYIFNFLYKQNKNYQSIINEKQESLLIMNDILKE